ncbi:MAG: hypothetical protein ACRDHZ_07555, partial [Ktedonobacteraceae bacterium]
MTGFFKNMGIGLNQDELYTRAFKTGVLLGKFVDAADTFDKAANKFTETNNPAMATQARANALLYRYLGTGDANQITPLLGILQNLPQLEAIGSQTEMMPIDALKAELDCRLVEDAIAHTQNNVVRSRDLHKLAGEKFQTILRNPLITYDHLKPQDGHDKTDMRYFYHNGMYNFYEAMTKKDRDPLTASDDLSVARQSFKRCN